MNKLVAIALIVMGFLGTVVGVIAHDKVSVLVCIALIALGAYVLGTEYARRFANVLKKKI